MIDKRKIKAFLQDDKFNEVLKVLNQVHDKWHGEQKKRENEFETIWNMAYLQGKVDGTKEFIEILEKEAYD